MDRIKILCTVAALTVYVAFSSLMAYAENNVANDMVLYNLQGPVKEVRIESKMPVIAVKTLKFDKTGQLNENHFTYNNEGHVVGFGDFVWGKYNDLFVIYDESMRPAKFLRHDNTTGFGSYELVNAYDGNRLSSRKLTYPTKKGDKIVSIEYSGEKYDSMGNWTERQARQTVTGPDGKVKSSEYTETRRIEYYE